MAVIGWDREHDRFRVGQWLYGRIYERRCDLSPEGRGCYFDRHQLRNARTGETVDLPAWEWAEVDRGRIVWAEAGVLFAARVERRGLGAALALHDFNGLAFERLEAPY